MGKPRGPGGSLPFVDDLYSLTIRYAVAQRPKRKTGRRVEESLSKSIEEEKMTSQRGEIYVQDFQRPQEMEITIQWHLIGPNIRILRVPSVVFRRI